MLWQFCAFWANAAGCGACVVCYVVCGAWCASLCGGGKGRFVKPVRFLFIRCAGVPVIGTLFRRSTAANG
eukprot:scaffold209654_cov32-Attheya_sp.AAC.1